MRNWVDTERAARVPVEACGARTRPVRYERIFNSERCGGLPVLDVLTFVLAAVAVIVALQYLADRTGLPAAALLTVAGLVYGVLPGPNVTLDPHVILTFVIPPLIYSAALNSSLLALRENLRTVISLSIGLVLA